MGRKRAICRYSSEAKSESPMTTMRTGFFDSESGAPFASGTDMPVVAAGDGNADLSGPW